MAQRTSTNCCLPLPSPVVLSVPPVPMATRGERCCLDGRAGRLNSGKAVVAYGSGKHVVIRNLDGEALLPNLENTTLSSLSCLVYRGHGSPVTAVKMSPSGAFIASGDEKGALRVWAFDHEEHLTRYETPCATTGPVRDFDWDGESKRLAIAGERAEGDARSESAKVLQAESGNSLGQLSQHIKGRVSSVAFKPDRPLRIVTAGREDSKCQFHKGPPFSRVPVQDGVPCEVAHAGNTGKGKGVHCIRYNSKGTLVASVSTDRSVCLYDGKTLELKTKSNAAHKATIYCCAWSSDDKHLLTASGDGTCKLFSVSDDGNDLDFIRQWKPAERQLGETITKDFAPVGGCQLGCAFVKGDVPVSVGLNGQISVLPKASGGADGITVLTGHYAAVDAMAVDPARGVFYTGDTDGIICQWDLATCRPTSRVLPAEGNVDLMYVVHRGTISGLAVAGDGSLMSVGWDDKLYLSKDGKAGVDPLSLPAQPSAVAAGTTLGVVATVKGLVLVDQWGKAVSDMISIPYAAQAVCVTKDDKTVFVGGDDCKVYIYSVVSGGSALKEKHVIDNGHLKPVHAFALSNDGTKLASADVRDVCVFDLRDGKYDAVVGRGRWCFHVQRVTCLAWSPDDRVVASGGADDSIYLWSVDKPSKRIHYPYAHRGGLTGVHFLESHSSSATGLKLVSAGIDSVVNQWDVTKDVAAKFA